MGASALNPGGNGAATDARGNIRTITYDNQSRMNGINYTIAGLTKPTPNVSVTYEPQFGHGALLSEHGRCKGAATLVAASQTRSAQILRISNLLSRAASRVIGTATKVAAPLPRLCLSGAVDDRFDLDGNMLTDGTTGYEWDAENRLIAISRSPTGRVEFSYDAFSRRVRIVEKAIGTLALEADKQLIWAGTEIIEQRNVTNGTSKRYFANGEMVSDEGGGPGQTKYVYTRDHLGSIRELVNLDGGTAARYDYTPYGIRTALQESETTEYGYTGHYTNAKTGLVLAPYRAYSPFLARWISRDPIEEDGGINLYGYVGNGPTGAVDPLGLDDFGALVDIDLVAITGVEISFGVVCDTDEWSDSGFFFSWGYAGGANVGGGVGVFWAPNEIEGMGAGVDINAGKYSITNCIDDQGNYNGFSATVGPGAGASSSVMETTTLSISNIVNSFSSLWNGVSDWLP